MKCILIAGLLAGSALWARPLAQPTPAAAQSVEVVRAPDPFTLLGPRNYLTGWPTKHADGGYNVVVEVPAGTNEKWEVDKKDGAIRWEKKKGKPRVIQYMSYPGSYGMFPRTLLPSEEGGDGDPLDAIVLGPAVDRGAVVRVKVIGVLRLLDDGEQDDKLICVRKGEPLGDADDLEELDRKYPGASTIVATWFAGYKDPGKIEILGLASAKEAERILDVASAAFEARHAAALPR